jgi:hypothetical protein
MEQCDAPRGASYLNVLTGESFCRCIVCSRCGHHTGNSNQGHYWGVCKVAKTKRELHFCCPDNCELEE